MPDKFTIGDQDCPALRRDPAKQHADQKHARSGVAISTVIQDGPGEWKSKIPDHNSQHQQVQVSLPILPARTVDDHGQFSFREEWEQDVQNVLLREAGVMEDPSDHANGGFDSGIGSVDLVSNLAMERGFGLNDAEKDLSNTAERVYASVWQAFFEIGREGVKMV